MRNRKKEQGFTLIELLVVVAILAVLAGVAVPRVMGALTSAKQNADWANLTIMQSAVERYRVDFNGSNPAHATPETVNIGSVVYTRVDSSKLTTYLAKIPTVQHATGDFYFTNSGIVHIILGGTTVWTGPSS